MLSPHLGDYRCIACNKLIAKKKKEGIVEVKCLRCGTINTFFHAMKEQVILTNPEGIIIFVSGGIEEITGYTLEEAVGKTPALWGGLMSKSFYEKLWHIKKQGYTYDGEIVNRRKDGSLYTVMAHISPIKNESGEVIGFIATEEDITHIREAEILARENEERFIELTSKISEVYWITELSPIEKIVYISPAFETIWGIEREEVYKNPRIWIDSIHEEDREYVLQTFNTFLAQEGKYDVQYRVVRRDEKIIWIEDKGEIVFDKKGNITRVVGVARDITFEKSVDEAKTDFVSLASHQLKTPIGAISWDAEMLLNGDYGKLEEKQKEIITQIYNTNLRMKQLVDGLLNVSRIDLGTFIIEPEDTNCVELCEEVLLEMQSKIILKQQTVVKEYSNDLPHISADSKLLRIIFQNLISNAIKYTPEKGKIVISLKVQDHEIVLSVANNGITIPHEEQSKIFHKLFRASNAAEMDADGTGLGLYLVKSIVDTAGGRVWFDSVEGQDTIFYVAFPLSGMKSKVGTKRLN